jgi:hypothetical protein
MKIVYKMYREIIFNNLLILCIDTNQISSTVRTEYKRNSINFDLQIFNIISLSLTNLIKFLIRDMHQSQWTQHLQETKASHTIIQS